MSASLLARTRCTEDMVATCTRRDGGVHQRTETGELECRCALLRLGAEDVDGLRAERDAAGKIIPNSLRPSRSLATALVAAMEWRRDVVVDGGIDAGSTMGKSAKDTESGTSRMEKQLAVESA